MADDERFWTVPELRARGWTPQMIERLLGRADRIDPRPRRGVAPPRLYLAARVEGVEKTEQFRVAAEEARARKVANAAQRAKRRPAGRRGEA